jgi:hypothetical protein
MTRMNLSIVGCLALAAFADAGTASADRVAINVTGPINPPAKDTAPFNCTQGTYVLGFVFRANSAISALFTTPLVADIAGAGAGIVN